MRLTPYSPLMDITRGYLLNTLTAALPAQHYTVEASCKDAVALQRLLGGNPLQPHTPKPVKNIYFVVHPLSLGDLPESYADEQPSELLSLLAPRYAHLADTLGEHDLMILFEPIRHRDLMERQDSYARLSRLLLTVLEEKLRDRLIVTFAHKQNLPSHQTLRALKGEMSRRGYYFVRNRVRAFICGETMECVADAARTLNRSFSKKPIGVLAELTDIADIWHDPDERDERDMEVEDLIREGFAVYAGQAGQFSLFRQAKPLSKS